MKRFGILLLVLTLWSLGTGCFAQIKVTGNTAASEAMILFDVKDAVNGHRLRDVVVSLSSSKDTTYSYSDINGLAMFNNTYLQKDSVEIRASIMGYKSLSLKTVFKTSYNYVEVLMTENPEEINAIIVKDNAMLMVMRGDTTVYNTKLLLTMEGDNLADLLTKLPGIEVKDGEVIAKGNKVNKILFNGNMLFGSNITDALNMVKSDMVKEVKVYEQHDQARLIEADTLKPKEQVLDVITKDPLKGVMEFALNGTAGIYTERDHEDKIEHIEQVGLNFKSYTEGKPDISVSGNAGKNMSRQGINWQPASSPVMSANARFDISNRKQFKSSYDSKLYFDANRNESYTSTEDVYTGMDRTNSRIEASDMRSLNLDWKGQYKFQQKEKHQYDMGADMAFRYSKSILDGKEEIKNNGDSFLSQLQKDAESKSFSSNLKFGYRYLSPKRNTFNIGLSLPYSLGRAAGSHVDTLSSSSYPQFMTNDRDSYFVNPTLQVSWRYNFTTSFSLMADASAQFKHTHTEQISFDQLLQAQNDLETYGYSQNNINGKVGVKATYFKKAFRGELGLSPQIISQFVNEERGNIGNSSKLFFMLAPSLRLTWNRTPMRLSLDYTENGICPSVEQLRTGLDNNNPLYLRAGNPNLKLSIARTALLNIFFGPLKNGSITANVNYRNQSNRIGNNTTYFAADTYLDEYGYTAEAGSQLTKPENIGSSHHLHAFIHTSFFINALKSNFNINVNGTLNNNPFMVAGQKNLTRMREIGALLGYSSAFSRVFSLTLNGKYSYGTNRMNSQKVYNYHGVSASASPSVIFLKNYKFSALYDIQGQFTDREGAGYLYDTLNCSLEGTFGKRKQYIVSIHANDILNSTRSRSYSLDELYMRSMSRSVLGRNVLLQFVIKFK